MLFQNISALIATQAICRNIHNHLQNCFPQTTMPVSVTLEHARSSDHSRYKFIVTVSFSLTSVAPRTSRLLSMVECTSTDPKRLYARTTGGVLHALQIRDWRRSRRVRQYKRCVRIALRARAVCDLEAVFRDCSRALHCAAARERGDICRARTDEPRSEYTREEQQMLDLASSLPLAQRARYLSLFI